MESRSTLLIPIVLIILGIGWLLSVIGVAPSINWVWTLGLAGVGLFTFVMSGIDKVTVVVGPLFIISSFLSIARQSGRISMDLEVPILVLLSGILMLIARMSAIPRPKWLDDAALKPE